MLLYILQDTHEFWEVMQEMYSNVENTSQYYEIRFAIHNTQQGLRKG